MSVQKEKSRDCGSCSTKSIRGVNSKLNCHHSISSVVRVAKKGRNVGRKFHGCSLWPDENCGFFKWEDGDDANLSAEDGHVDVYQNNSKIIDLEFENRLLEEKIKKLKGKNIKLKEEVHQKNNQVREMYCKILTCARNEKKYSICLTLSWLMFAIVFLFYK
ncbi:unnamed protein product [Cuscuta epithymum]|uniref:GRF-type domain-containing protein n=1 Tax=Cuscuta epithymum TaxID=186058 RepID=A0AAV0FTB3_9ASTE|nr:unnamed protein product [Cuscuta epithymum]